MWVAIVGSRALGSCSCKPDFPPSTTDREHAPHCPRVVEWQRMMHIVTRLSKQPGFEGIVSGGAQGADTLAKRACEAQRIRCVEYHPKPGPEPFWQRAHARNQQIVDKADMVIAVFAPIPSRTPGTSDTVSRAKLAGKPVHVFHNGRWTQE